MSPYQHVKEPSEYAKNLMAEAGFQDIIVDAKQLRFHYNGIQNLRSRLRRFILYLFCGNIILSSCRGCEGGQSFHETNGGPRCGGVPGRLPEPCAELRTDGESRGCRGGY